MKKCKKCQKELPLEAFPLGTTSYGAYRRGTCVDCMKTYYRDFKRRRKADELKRVMMEKAS